jgi:hypothetical protein
MEQILQRQVREEDGTVKILDGGIIMIIAWRERDENHEHFTTG